MSGLPACPDCGLPWNVVSTAEEPVAPNQTLTICSLECGHEVKIYEVRMSETQPVEAALRGKMRSCEKVRAKPRREVKFKVDDEGTESRISVERGEDPMDTEVLHEVRKGGERIHHHHKKKKGEPGE